MTGIVCQRAGWTRLGRRPGPIMYALGFMRVQRCRKGWRAWDVVKIGGVRGVRSTHETTIHDTLRYAKARCERVIAGGGR